MKKTFFGTDGIRGLYGQYPLTPHDMWALGWAVGRWILEQGVMSPCVFIGKDTRASCAVIQEAVSGGLIAAGIRVVALGCVPTPAVSFLTRKHGASMGLMISASHNPAPYNGIKFFNSQGEKLSTAHEQEISLSILQAAGKVGSGVMPFEESGLLLDYTDFLHHHIPNIGPMRLVVDCAHGAYSAIAPQVLQRAGALLVDVFGAEPDGGNINAECGAVYPQRLCQSVVFHQADAGICFDGDGDRVIVVNRQGVVQDGDQILAALSENLAHMLVPNINLDSAGIPGISGVVGTVISNLGLEHFLQSKQIPFVRTDVGDRVIARKLKELSWNLGGEPCGHILLTDALPTGDGLLAGLHVLKKMHHNPDLFPQFQPRPSVMRNIILKVPDLDQNPEFLDYSAALQASLGQEERVLLRISGTEPLIRILVEGPCQDYVHHLAKTIACTLEEKQEAITACRVSS